MSELLSRVLPTSELVDVGRGLSASVVHAFRRNSFRGLKENKVDVWISKKLTSHIENGKQVRQKHQCVCKDKKLPGHAQCQPANARLPRAIWLVALCRGTALRVGDVHLWSTRHDGNQRNMHFAFSGFAGSGRVPCGRDCRGSGSNVLLPGVLAAMIMLIGSASLPVKIDASGGSTVSPYMCLPYFWGKLCRSRGSYASPEQVQYMEFCADFHERTQLGVASVSPMLREGSTTSVCSSYILREPCHDRNARKAQS